jgi:succinate-acetate transporter protein
MADGSKQTNGARFHASLLPVSGSSKHVVAVRYYLDRPGYDLQHSSVRFWRDPPATCSASNVANFLEDQGIKDDTIIAEIYLDKFESYMLLEACEADNVKFDFSSTTVEEPGILNIRLTDTSSGGSDSGKNQAFATPHNCNTSPVGLFAFSLTVALETANLLGKLAPNSVAPSFVLTYGPYGFWLSGLLQLIVGMFEVTRNNIFGATAFMAFGSFWLANGTKLILENYFPAEIPDDLLVADPVGNFIRNFYIFGFVCVLLKQTLIMNKLITSLISLLAVMMLSTSLTGWSVAFEWIQMVFGWMVSLFAFYLFTAEFTNEVYQREVFNMHPWVHDSSDEVFGAAGRANTLQSKATKLRLAHSLSKKDVQDLRTALPENTKEE